MSSDVPGGFQVIAVGATFLWSSDPRSPVGFSNHRPGFAVGLWFLRSSWRSSGHRPVLMAVLRSSPGRPTRKEGTPHPAHIEGSGRFPPQGGSMVGPSSRATAAVNFFSTSPRLGLRSRQGSSALALGSALGSKPAARDPAPSPRSPGLGPASCPAPCRDP